MVTKKNTKIYARDRQALKTVFSKAPYYLLVDFHNQCNQKCLYCPRLVEPRYDMDMKLWTKILKDYKKLAEIYGYPRGGRIGVGAFGEPFLDDSIWDYVEEAKRLGMLNLFYFNTNGTAWTEKSLDKVIEYIGEFAYGNTTFMVHLVNEDSIKLCQALALRCHESTRPTPGFIAPIIPGGSKTSPYSVNVTSRAGLLWDVEDREVFGCSGEEPYLKMVIRPTGEVVFCCNDFHYEWPIGNLTNNTIQEVWNGKRRLELISQLEHGGKNTMCTHCDEALTKKEMKLVEENL